MKPKEYSIVKEEKLVKFFSLTVHWKYKKRNIFS